MDIGLHHRPQRGIDRAVPGKRPQALTDHMHVEMAAPVATGMAGVTMAVVLDLQHARRQRLLQRITDPLDPFRVHGSTLPGGPARV